MLSLCNLFQIYLQELESKKQYMETLQRVADEPAMGQNELEVLNQSVRNSYLDFILLLLLYFEKIAKNEFKKFPLLKDDFST